MLELQRNSAPKSKRQRLWPVVALVLVCVYFAFHTLFGSRGYYQLKKLEVQEKTLATQYKALKKDEKALKNKVDMMRPEHLDADMAEELARKNLGFTRPDEVVIDLIPNKNPN